MAFTGATSGLAAGAQTNDTVLDYAQEVNYGVPPSGNYQLMRITGETLTRSQTTARPDEINPVKEVAQSVVTQVQASGSISGALSTATFDDLLAGVLGSDWDNNVATKTVASADSNNAIQIRSRAGTDNDVLWAHSGTPFVRWSASGFVRIISSSPVIDIVVPYDSIDGSGTTINLGKNRLNAIRPQLAKLLAIASPTPTQDLPANLPAGSILVSGGIINGNIDKTYTFRKKLLSGWLMYSGSLVTQMQIQLQQGQFGTVSVDVTSKSEARSPSDVSSGSLPAPTGIVHNTVKNFLGVTIFGKVPAGCVTNCSITLARDGSGNDYGNGHADACGARSGSLTASGSLEFYFRTWDEYDAMLAGTQGPIVIKSVDNDGNGYAFIFLNAALRNGKVNTSQKNQTVKATFDIEGNPLPSGTTFAISRITPAA